MKSNDVKQQKDNLPFNPLTQIQPPQSFPDEIFISIVKGLTSNFNDHKSLKAYSALSRTCHYFYDQYYLDAMFLSLWNKFINVVFICPDSEPSRAGYKPFRIGEFNGEKIQYISMESDEWTKGHEQIERIRRIIKEKNVFTIGICRMNPKFLLRINGSDKKDNDYLDTKEDCVNIWYEGFYLQVEKSYNWKLLAGRRMKICKMKDLRERFGH